MQLLTKTFILTAVFAASTSAHATLIGDTITMNHYFPDLASPAASPTTFVVQAGNADVITPYFGVYYANAEANDIFVNFTFGDAQWTVASFNGLVVSGIDDVLTNVSVSTNFSGWNNGRLTFDAHSISANWNGLAFNNDTYFNIHLNSASVPDGGSTIALLGLAMTAVAGARRKFGI